MLRRNSDVSQTDEVSVKMLRSLCAQKYSSLRFEIQTIWSDFETHTTTCVSIRWNFYFENPPTICPNFK